MIQRNEFAARKLAKDGVAIGKKFCGTAYPNPTRAGCPDTEMLKAMAKRDRRIALQDMPISHIVSCSPCFNEYARYRRTAVAFTRLRWAAVVLLVTAAAFTTTRFLNFGTSGQSRVATAEKSHSTPAEVPPPSASVAAESPSQIEVNLALFTTTRGDGSEKVQQQIHLPAKRLHVLFLLPTGMEPGKYVIRLQDAAGSAKFQHEVKVVLSGGVASFALDLQFEPSDIGRGWKLMIREPGLSWRSYPVIVG